MRYRRLQLVLVALIAVRILWNVGSGAGLYWDFVNFYNAGTRVYSGQPASLYRPPVPVAGEAPVGAGVFEYVGFPLSALLFAPLGALPPRSALLAFKAACAVCFGLGLFTLYAYSRDRIGGIWRSEAALCVYLVLALFFEPFWFVFTIGGQATALVFLLLALAAASYVADRVWASALCLSVAMLLKPAFALMGVVFLLAGAWPLLARLVGCLAGEGVLSLLVFGWPIHLEWARMVLRESARWAVPWWNNASILSVAANFWIYAGTPRFDLEPPPAAFNWIQIAIRLLILIVWAWLIRRAVASAATPRDRRHLEMIVAIPFPLFLSIVVWPHYLALLFLPLLAVAARFDRLPTFGRVLIALMFLSTARANISIVRWLDSQLPTNMPLAVLAAGFFGGGTLLLLLILTLVYNAAVRPKDLAEVRL